MLIGSCKAVFIHCSRKGTVCSTLQIQKYDCLHQNSLFLHFLFKCCSVKLFVIMLILSHLSSLAPPSLFFLTLPIDFSPLVRGHRDAFERKHRKSQHFLQIFLTFHFLLQRRNFHTYIFLARILLLLFTYVPKSKKLNFLLLLIEIMQAKVTKISCSNTVKGRWIYKKRKIHKNS